MIGEMGSLFALSLLLIPFPPPFRQEGPEMVLIEGGTFLMGDQFGEGGQDETPVHAVTLGDFLLAPHEVTVAGFQAFVAETGYVTSAEGPYDPEATRAIMERAASGQMSREEILEARLEILRYAGAGYWDAEERRWMGYAPQTNWMDPGVPQAPDHPVLAVSWDDAIHFCNWLSGKHGLPAAYDLTTGELLDGAGDPTTDLARVRGFRLPTEAEWEYAAREGGRKVRFGNGEDVARSSGMNIRGDDGDQPYLERGSYRKATTPVGSFPANRLGLHDMSGNAWEWVSDTYVSFDATASDNPYAAEGTLRILRGGAWGLDAFEARASRRTSWPRNDRCNNAGFRIARSVGED
jgi:formylglycine-generating enzyme required for sulfatase activity